MQTIKDKIKLLTEQIESLQSELNDLLQYTKNNPEEIYLPNTLQLICDLNPDDVKCRIYES